MRKFILALSCCLVMSSPLAAPAFAAEEEAPAAPPTFIYATYSRCHLNGQDRADEIVKNVMAPVYDEALAAGKILGWGWLGHNTGGPWRRVDYVAAAGWEALLDGLREINEKLDKEHPLAGHEFAGICDSHDDYIWRYVTGSRPGPESVAKRAAAGFSVYFECDSQREDEADAIVKDVIGPLYDAQVKKGSLSSWSWFAHYVGGEYRRLAVADGADFKALLHARDAIIKDLTDKHADAAKKFDEICGSHQDYMWDIKIAKP